MSNPYTPARWKAQLPRAFVTLSGLYLFHILSGDALASWSMLGLAVFAILARVNGSIENRKTRIELSLISTACVLVFLQGGQAALFNNPSLPFVFSVLILLIGLNAVNVSIPHFKLLTAPLLFLLFFASQRFFHPMLEWDFEQPIIALALLTIAWELLSSVIHAKRDAPSLTETGAGLALLFIHYHESSYFRFAATWAVGFLLAYFAGALDRSEAGDRSSVIESTIQRQRVRGFEKGRRRSYLLLSLIALALFSGISWSLSKKASHLPFFESLETPGRPLAIEQRNRIGHALLSKGVPDPVKPKRLAPLNINVLEDALARSNIRKENTAITRKVIVRTDSDRSKLNVGERDHEDIRVTSVSKLPSLRISAPQSSLLLPNYALETELDPAGKENASRSITFDFGIGTEPTESNADPQSRPNLGDRTASEPLKLRQTKSPATPEIRQSLRQTGRTRRTISKRPPGNVQTSVGFGSELEYSENVSIELDTRPILEVFLPGSAKWTNSLYLRFNTLARVQSDRFVSYQVNSPAFLHRIDQGGWHAAPGVFQSDSDSTDPWTIVTGNDWKNGIPLLGQFQSIQIPIGNTLIADENAFSIRREKGSGPLAYRFTGPQVSNTRSLKSLERSEAEKARLTELPLSPQEIAYLKRLANRIGGKSPNTGRFAQKVGIYFENTHPYQFDFKFKANEGHLLVSWLKSRSPGICGYYAGAFTLLARAKGIPARVVVGALTREFDSQSRKFVVRDRDAHAWAEYINEDDEWVRADLTPISLNSPRFAPERSNSEIFSNNVQAALHSLDSSNPSTASVPVARLKTEPERSEDLATLVEIPTVAIEKESVSNTADILDQINQSEPNEIALTAGVASENESNSDWLIAPVPETNTPSVAPAVSSSSVSEFTTLNEDIPSIPIDEEAEWSLNPRVAINGIFVLLILGFAISQITRAGKQITTFLKSGNPQPLRERILAGRLLQEIESRYSESDNAPSEWLDIRQRAIQLRYGSECTLLDIKALNREFHYSLKMQQARR